MLKTIRKEREGDPKRTIPFPTSSNRMPAPIQDTQNQNGEMQDAISCINQILDNEMVTNKSAESPFAIRKMTYNSLNDEQKDPEKMKQVGGFFQSRAGQAQPIAESPTVH